MRLRSILDPVHRSTRRRNASSQRFVDYRLFEHLAALALDQSPSDVTQQSTGPSEELIRVLTFAVQRQPGLLSGGHVVLKSNEVRELTVSIRQWSDRHFVPDHGYR